MKAILELEMPENCDACPLQMREDIGMAWHCAITGSWIEDGANCRLSNCRLKEGGKVTVKELYNALEKLMQETPNTADDEIYYYGTDEIYCYGTSVLGLLSVNKVEIEYDIETIGRYICLE